MASKNVTQVLIGGKIYTLGGFESEEYLQRVAAYLNNKITQIKTLEGYARMAPEQKSLLLNLNTADDYFKLKHQADQLSDQLAQKDRELYEIKHELITAQLQLEKLRMAEMEEEDAAEAVKEPEMEEEEIALPDPFHHSGDKTEREAEAEESSGLQGEKAPGDLEEFKLSEELKLSEEPGTAEAPELSEESGLSEEPELSKEPGLLEESGISEEFEIPEAPEASEVPESLEDPRRSPLPTTRTLKSTPRKKRRRR